MTSSIVCPEPELVGRIRQGIVARCGHSGPEADGLLDRAHLEELKQIQREAGEPIVAGMITRIGQEAVEPGATGQAVMGKAGSRVMRHQRGRPPIRPRLPPPLLPTGPGKAA